jgi:D-alanyl-lipoteichoic acid acyltransferase DltB (MBOAT superfamily)
MLFPTATFAIFFLIVLPLNWLLMPNQPRWRIFILAASYIFYGWWDWHYTLLLALSTVGNQFAARAINATESPRPRKLLLWVAILGNLGALGYFKYYDFFLSSAQNTLNEFGVDYTPTIIGVALPVGISFFTFQALSYVIDTYRGIVKPTSLMRFAVYLSFFPHLVAGPIVRASEFLPQLTRPRDPRRIDASRAYFLILGGLFKKVVIASYLGSNIVDPVFGAPDQHSSLEILIAIYAYAVQIWADFSGYTDIAIGVALLLGFQFPQNFDSPYTATSVQDFWRRWHMTLSRWLRDYVYIPLGGSRGGSLKTYRNLLLTFLLGGLWHGAAWRFVIWGAIHGTALSVERMFRERAGASPRPDTATRRWIRRFVTFQVVCLAWVFFRADTWNSAWEMLGRLFTEWGQASPLVTFGVVAAIAGGIGVQYVSGNVVPWLMERFSRVGMAGQAAMIAGSLVVIDTLGPQGVPPFIYFRF